MTDDPKAGSAPASVTPASDQEIARHKSMLSDDDWRCWDGSDRAVGQLIARIESEKAQNAELREEGQKLKTAIDDLKRTVTEASMRRHEEITTLRARLAEVSEAAQATVASYDPDGWNWRNLGSYIDALKAVLAKGDK